MAKGRTRSTTKRKGGTNADSEPGTKKKKRKNSPEDAMKNVIDSKRYSVLNGLDTCFKMCCSKPHLVSVAMLETMVADGADINKRFKKGDTSLHRLLFHAELDDEEDQRKLLKLLTFFEQKGDLNVTDDDGDTAAMLAVALVHKVKVVKRLTEKSGDDSAKKTNSRGHNLLHILMASNFEKTTTPHLLKYLLQLGVDINGQDEKGNTPLHLLFKYTDKDYMSTKSVKYRSKDPKFDEKPVLRMVKMILEKGANCNVLNKIGQTPLMLAIDKINYLKLEHLQLLLSPLNAVKFDHDGNSPLSLFLLHRTRSDTDENVLKFAEELLKLDELQPSHLVTMMNIDMETPLFLALQARCQMDLIVLLCARGAVPTKKEIEQCIQMNLHDALFYFLENYVDLLKNLNLNISHPHILLKLWYYQGKSLKLLRTMIEVYKFSTAIVDDDEGSVLHKCVQYPHAINNMAWFDYLLSIESTSVDVLVVRKTPLKALYKKPSKRDGGVITCSSEVPFSTPLVYAFSEGENQLAAKLITNFANVNLRKLLRLQINEDLSDALRLLFNAGYRHPLPDLALNVVYFSENYNGLIEEQFERFAEFERRKLNPLFKLASIAVREVYGKNEVLQLAKIPLRPWVTEALLGEDMEPNLTINRKGGLEEKPDAMFVIPEDNETQILYQKLMPHMKTRGLTKY